MSMPTASEMLFDRLAELEASGKFVDSDAAFAEMIRQFLPDNDYTGPASTLAYVLVRVLNLLATTNLEEKPSELTTPQFKRFQHMLDRYFETQTGNQKVVMDGQTINPEQIFFDR